MTATAWADSVSGCAVRAAAASLIGNYRENNEDFVHIDPEFPFALVLDGMGGMAAGELASRDGAGAVARALRDGLRAGAEPPGLIEQALRAGQEAVLDLGRSDPTLRNCGTTVVLALVHRGRAFVSWLGDSPAYRVSCGRVERLTWDHDLRNALVRHGIIRAEEAREHRIDNVLCRYLGSPEKDATESPEVPSFAPRPGDRLVLATDGISGIVPEPVLLRCCLDHPDPQVCAEELVSLALECGSRDNCSCAVLAFDGGDGSLPAAPARKWWCFWK